MASAPSLHKAQNGNTREDVEDLDRMHIDYDDPARYAQVCHIDIR